VLTLAGVCLPAWAQKPEKPGYDQISDIHKDFAEHRMDREYRVRGAVTIPTRSLPDHPEVFYIQDGMGGLSIRPSELLELEMGDVVEVRGKIKAVDFVEPELQAVEWRKEGTKQRKEPTTVSVRDVAEGRFDCLLVRVRGQVERVSEGESRDTLYLQDGQGRVIRAYTRRDSIKPPEITKTAVPGSEVEVIGVLLPMVTGENQVRIRSGSDVILLKKPVVMSGRTMVVLISCGALGLLWIVTLRRAVRRQTREIKELLTKAQESSRLKSEFLANVSHEIRTPVHGILGMQSLLLDSPLNSEQREQLKIAQDTTRHLLTLLNDFLDLSRIEADRVVLEQDAFDPKVVVRDAMRSMEARAREKGVDLVMEVEDSPDTVIGDPGRLRQVLLNLISNAVKFTEEGSVSLICRRAGEEGDVIRLSFEVQDTGIGIPKEKHKEIFESFTQADGSITRRYGGSGLGLAIASKLVKRMGGRMELDSEPDRGSTFRFTLPFGKAQRAVEPARMEPAALPAALARLRILVAEDNRVNQVVVERHMQKAGHDVVLVSDGAAAIETLTREPFDLVLMDVQMPGMDGLEAARTIRSLQLPGSPRVPIVALTAHSRPEDVERCYEAGMDGYISKPFEPRDLNGLLERFGSGRPQST
jgi:signal transduction histidine kinase/ActR/RegA family two-component response regulator